MNSNVPALFESLTRLKNLGLPENTAVFFGHGERITYGDMLKKFDCFTKTLVISVKPHNGEMTELEDVYLDGDTLMLSLSDTAKCFYNSDAQSAVAFLPDMTRLKVKAGSPYADLDGFTVDMKAPAQFRDGKIYLSGKFTAQIFKDFLTWSLTAK